jgi:hypothetical protein
MRRRVPTCRIDGGEAMRSRTAALLAALLLIGLLPGTSMAARPAPTITYEIVQLDGISSLACDDFFELADVSWNGITVDGSFMSYGTFTEPGFIDQPLGSSITHSKTPSSKGSTAEIVGGTIPAGARVGGDVLLLFHGKFVADLFIDFGTCTV